MGEDENDYNLPSIFLLFDTFYFYNDILIRVVNSKLKVIE